MASKSPCLEMEHLLPGNDREIVLFSTILKLCFEKGWIIEDEMLRIDSKTTLSEKKSEFFDVLKTMKCDENAIRLFCVIRSMNQVESAYKRNEEHDHHLSNISNLFEESLFAQGKKLPFENILKNSDSETDVSESATKAMLLGPVIRCVLQYLNLKDIKQCRRISKEWKSIADPVLRNRSIIEFSNPPNPDDIQFSPSKFREQFASTLETIPFTAYWFSGYDSSSWALNELNDFFHHESGNIRELQISNLILADENKKLILSFDITPWIETSPVTRNNPKYHTKLDILGLTSSLVIVQYTILANVKELSLVWCQINLNSNQDEEIKLLPIKLELTNVLYFRDGKLLPELFINEIVDFSRVKHIELQHFKLPGDPEWTKFSLSLKGNDQLRLNYLLLHSVTVTDWRECTWTVDKLEMSENSFVEKTKMQIWELGLSYLKVIDLSVLPQSLNRLTISFYDIDSCFSSQKVILDNLHYLNLSGLNEDIFSCISKYVECPNLIYLEAFAHQNSELEIYSNWLPRSVKKLKLYYVTVNWGEGRKDFDLDKLVLIDNYFCGVKKIANILSKTKELVLRCELNNISESVDNLLKYLHLMKRSDYLQRLYVGPLDWTEDYSFEESPLVDYVNKKGRYYLFENQEGKALDVSDEEFEDIGNIEPITSAKG